MTDAEHHVVITLPALLFLAGCSLLLCWSVLRQQMFLLWIAMGYLPTGVGLTLQSSMSNAELSFWAPLTAILYLVGATCFAHGVGLRLGGKPQPKTTLLIALATLMLLVVFSRVHESLAMRLIVLNVGLGLIYVLKLPAIRRNWARLGRWERLIGLSYTFSTIYALLRGVFVAATYGHVSYEGLTQSSQWSLLLLGSLFFSLWLAFIVIVCAVSGVIDTLRNERDTDPLSGLLNRRAFMRRVALLDSSREKKGEWFLLSCDIDHFKRVNDTMGHAAGDRVISHVASILQSAAGKHDLVARFGGEEFILAMHRPDLNQASADAEAIRLRIQAASPAEVPCPITASFGLCRLEPSRPVTEALVLADILLYDAKASGRNCLVIDLRPAGASREFLPAPEERVLESGWAGAPAHSTPSITRAHSHRARPAPLPS